MGNIDAELFVKEKTPIFLILPEENTTKKFVASLMIQKLIRELFAVANEPRGRLPNGAVFYCDELSAMPPSDILPLFSAVRSRRLTLIGEKSFAHFLCIEGSGAITCEEETIAFQKGDSLFMPANSGRYEIKGSCEMLVTTI